MLKHFKSDPVSFTYIRQQDEPYIHQEVFASSRAVLYKPKRNKYISLPINDIDILISAISDALGGGVGEHTWLSAKELIFGQDDQIYHYEL